MSHFRGNGSSSPQLSSLSLMRVTAEEFLSRVAALYEAPVVAGRKATIAVSCKSVPATRVFPKGSAVRDDVLLFRAAKYGNNSHKTKFSVVIAPSAQAAFHSQLSHIVKTKADHRLRGNAVKRTGAKAKKTAE